MIHITNYYASMKIGEKRSITSSMKKAISLLQEEQLSFASMEKCLETLYPQWLKLSEQNQYSWFLSLADSSTLDSENISFREEMNTRFTTLITKEESFSFVPEPTMEDIAEPVNQPVTETIVELAKESTTENVPSSIMEPIKVSEPMLELSIRPLRSKRKRLRKKREKSLQLQLA